MTCFTQPDSYHLVYYNIAADSIDNKGYLSVSPTKNGGYNRHHEFASKLTCPSPTADGQTPLVITLEDGNPIAPQNFTFVYCRSEYIGPSAYIGHLVPQDLPNMCVSAPALETSNVPLILKEVSIS